MPSVHSKIVGSSTAKLRRICNASIEESQGIPEAPWNIYTATGTAIHTIVEESIRDNLGFKEIRDEFIGCVMEDVKITKEHIADKALPAITFYDRTVPDTAEVTLEKFLKHTYVHPKAGGTGDVIFNDSHNTGRVGAIDWKFGEVIVGEDGHDQLAFTLSAAIDNGLLPRSNKLLYEGYIFQPAAKLKPAFHATRFKFTLKELDYFVDDLRDAVNGPREYVTGDHCYGCSGKIRCKAYQAMLAAAVESDIPGLDTHEMGAALDMVPAIKKYIEELQAVAKRNAEQGRIPIGYGLEPSLGNRAWKDEKVAWMALGRLNVRAEERTIKSTISAPQALALLREIGIDEATIARFEKRHIKRDERGERLYKLAPGESLTDDLTRLANALQ